MDPRRYLERIGYDGPLGTGHATLAALQRAHRLAVPFDALDCHLGNPVSVDPGDAYRKVVEDRRGGFCYELNGLFAWLLEHLGFPVTRVSARPTTAGGELAPEHAHLALVVAADGRRWLADVGFGVGWAADPLDLDERGEQASGDERFRITEDGDVLVAERLGPDPDRYRFTADPVAPEAFAAQCRTYATDPQSPFVRNAPVAQVFEDGWARLTRTRLTAERGGRRVDRPVVDDADWRRELRRWFGLAVDGASVRAGASAGAGWETHGSAVAYENPWIRVREDDVTLPDGTRGVYGVVETRSPSVFVVALDDQDRVLLITQERYTTGRPSVEVPAGGADGEDPLAAAQRELCEETGHAAAEWRLLGRLEAMNGICTEVQHVFLARGLTHVGGDDAAREGITRVAAVPLDAVLGMVGRGEVTDGQTVSSLMLAVLDRYPPGPEGRTRQTSQNSGRSRDASPSSRRRS